MIQYRVVHGPKSLVADGLRTNEGERSVTHTRRGETRDRRLPFPHRTSRAFLPDGGT
jgi:hypothetical protein